MSVTLIRGCLLGAVLAVATLSSGTALAQTLLDVMGAGAIQNSLQSLPAGGASGVIERSRSTVDQSAQAEQQRLDLLQQAGGSGGALTAPAALMAPLMDMFRAMGFSGPAGSAANPARVPAQVNGQLVPYCSHGGLCHGALLRAIGSR
ncbi:MAG: hypothetical protein AB1Z22_03690 [Synechococcaceae cyanobacterium]